MKALLLSLCRLCVVSTDFSALRITHTRHLGTFGSERDGPRRERTPEDVGQLRMQDHQQGLQSGKGLEREDMIMISQEQNASSIFTPTQLAEPLVLMQGHQDHPVSRGERLRPTIVHAEKPLGTSGCRIHRAPPCHSAKKMPACPPMPSSPWVHRRETSRLETHRSADPFTPLPPS